MKDTKLKNPKSLKSQTTCDARNARKAVKAVRALLSEAHKDGYLQEVWILVGALRGPDEADPKSKINLKMFFTTPIRKALMGRAGASQLFVSDSHDFPIRPVWKPELVVEAPVDGHFMHHIKAAQRILNKAFPKT